ncbi:NAD kinase 2, mitochondrial-like isoform X1 [Tachypleus tridentatus]|uniref:NAD kinase 2, mitochondrial-like isoform X1 n=2 Tax=Tachypleus tridentatus TaxID=6853 RepID=UPI003FD19099
MIQLLRCLPVSGLSLFKYESISCGRSFLRKYFNWNGHLQSTINLGLILRSWCPLSTKMQNFVNYNLSAIFFHYNSSSKYYVQNSNIFQRLTNGTLKYMYNTVSYRNMSTSHYQLNRDIHHFRPKKALILTKFSRYEYEKRRHPDLSEEELIKNLEERGSDYQSLLHHHHIHTKNKDLVVETLRQHGIETSVVNRFGYTDANIEWADIIFTTGGDGTFLMAASKIHRQDKPVIGINSDPSRSVGHLCLPVKFTDCIPEAVEKLMNGQFKWTQRQRIRVTLKGEQAYTPPVELHNQQLQYPEYRFIDCYQEQHNCQKGSVVTPDGCSNFVHKLPVMALNEVFIGESLSSRVSYYELSVDGSPKVKIKSSGLTVCTGTGSTSWSFNINKLTPQCVEQLLKIVNEETGSALPLEDSKLVERITTRFNNSLIFDPSETLLAYTIRDPVVFGTGFSSKPRGFAKRIEVKSRMFDACLVIDGGLSFLFNDGAVATLDILEDDALRTVTLLD